MSTSDDIHEANRLTWNEGTRAHNSHKADQAKFLRAGGTTLYPEELEMLGDLQGKKLVHLQCNSGQDTLCLARLGANVTGVDISDTAIEFATHLSADSGIPAKFIRADIYTWLEQTAKSRRRFDTVFSSYGAFCWLSDLNEWAKGIHAILKRGGRFVLVDFHPIATTHDENYVRVDPYFLDGSKMSRYEDGISDYVATSGTALTPSGYLDGVMNFKNPYPAYEFTWTTADLLTALIDAGLRLTAYREYPYMNGDRMFKDMQETPGKRMYPAPGIPSLPLMFALRAEKR